MIVQYLFFSFLLYSALALTDPQLINAFYFPLMARASPGLHHPFMFNLRTKHFTSNVTRQAFGAPSVPLYIPIFFKGTSTERHTPRWESALLHVASPTMCRRPRLRTAWEDERVGGTGGASAAHKSGRRGRRSERGLETGSARRDLIPSFQTQRRL